MKKKDFNWRVAGIVLDPLYRLTKKKLDWLHNLHRGERCFLLAPGPSLNKSNLDLLKAEHIIGINGMFAKRNLDFMYFVVETNLFVRDYFSEYINLNCPVFYAGTAGIKYFSRLWKYHSDNIIPLKIRGYYEASDNLWKGTYTDGTAMNTALQVIYHLGYDEVYILGADCHYENLTSHFDGSKSHVKDKITMFNDWSTVFEMYEKNRIMFNKNHRQICNATVGGKLEVFPRVNLEDII